MYPKKKNDIVDAVWMLCVIEDEVAVDGDQEPKSYVGVNSFGFQAAARFFKTKLKNLSIMRRFAQSTQSEQRLFSVFSVRSVRNEKKFSR